MKKFQILLFSGLLASTSYSFAGNLSGRVGISDVSMASLWSGGEFNSDYTSTNYGVTYAFDNGYYVDYSMRLGEDKGTDILAATNFSRDDFSYTIGKSLGDGLSVFGGMIETEYSLDLNYTELGLIFTETVDYDGLFVGASQVYPLDMGFLAFSIAYADVDLTLSYSGNFNPGSFNATGDGFSYGVTYVYPLNDNLSVNSEFKQQVYDFSSGGNDQSGSLSVEDDLQTLGVNLVYNF